MALSWTLQGLALWAAARSLTWISAGDLPVYVPMSAMASTLGFLALTPGGLGVKELTLIFVLQMWIDNHAVCAITPIVLRLAQMLVELLLAGVGLIIQSRIVTPPYVNVGG